MRAPSRLLFFALLAVATLAFNFEGILHILSQTNCFVFFTCLNHRVVRETSLPGLLAEKGLEGKEIFFVTSGDPREESVERSLRQTLAWVAMPSAVHCSTAGEIGSEAAVFSPLYDDEANAAIAATGRYREECVFPGRKLWVKIPSPPSPEPGPPPPAVQSRQNTFGCSAPLEFVGLAPLAAVCLAGGLAAGALGFFLSALLFSLLLFLSLLFHVPATPFSVWIGAVLSAAASWVARRYGSRQGGRPSAARGRLPVAPLLAGLAVFAATAAIALAHRLVTPYGLAVTGGKARLWFLTGCIPHGFFTDDAAWGLLEPAYPPGCAALALGCFGAARACGDWLTQLAPCLFAAVAAAFLVSKASGWARQIWIVLLFLTPLALMTTGQFYPEPLFALGVLVGWERIRDGRASGWLLLGATGWFKNEGLMLLPAAWLAWRLAGGSAKARVRDLAAALALPATWHVGCRLAGASLHHYAPPWRLSPMRGLRALAEALRLAFAKPWAYAFAYPAAPVIALASWCRKRFGADTQDGAPSPPLRAALLFAAFSLLAFSLAHACSTADEAWHLGTSLPRLLWTPALVLAREGTLTGKDK